VTDEPPDAADEPHDGTDASPEPDGEDVVDTNVDRFIDRLVGSSGGSVTGNAMIGMAKGMGLHKKLEIAAEIREGDEPEPDPDDPIEVTIDRDHPENTRIVYRMPVNDD
jgi:hypothetical protein